MIIFVIIIVPFIYSLVHLFKISSLNKYLNLQSLSPVSNSRDPNFRNYLPNHYYFIIIIIPFTYSFT